MSKFQQGAVIVVLAILSYLLIGWHQYTHATEPMPETSVTTEPCYLTFGDKRFDGNCEFRYIKGVKHLGLYGEDGQLDIIIRLTVGNGGRAVFMSH